MSVSQQVALRFEPLRLEHVPALLEIEAEAYPDPWTPGMFHQETTNDTSHFFVAFRGQEIAGYAGFWLLIDEAHVTKITVAGRFRRQGLGGEILRHLLRLAEAAGANIARLEVRESNAAARRLYAAHGFEAAGLRKDYYMQSREAAVVMTRPLRSA